MISFYKKYKTKKRKGFIVSDAFVGMAVSAMLATVISGTLLVSQATTESQMETHEVTTLAHSLIEEIKATNVTTYEDLEEVTGLEGEFDTGALMLYSSIQMPMQKYDVEIRVETDSKYASFQVITVILRWEGTDGGQQVKEVKGFKVNANV